ncbi:electron transport complex subunit E [Alkalisalibacterium limincola]|uniref:Ion-translocating oxidoreductase complex subunit E n=1 Tax=Alkalisalibacterium limincola TaxID=2699169 RepID=A0A5C8KZQ7_9GAMM|nr:electron transport complex subunit E [Alkalisalibacterium limincola]TXK65932.1 electron transport complex subunit E [Alkalisalibacterium limincola]
MNPSPNPRTILEYGLSSGNAGLVQLLGLCPLLAVSNNAVNALGLGIATVLALVATNTVVSMIRRITRRDVRIPAFVMVIASVVTTIELSMRAFLPELHAVLGLFVPLIVTNCAIMGRAEAFASRTDPARAALDGFAIGIGFLWVLLAIGVTRELLGAGTVFAGAGALLQMPWLELTAIPDYRGFLVALLPPGAFVVLALLIALRNRLQRAPEPVRDPSTAAGTT